MLRGERTPAQKWSRRDALLAEALTEYEASLCTGCGQPRHLSMDKDIVWSAQLPVRCHACTEQLRYAKRYMEDPPAPEFPQALHFPVVATGRTSFPGAASPTG